MKTVFSSSWDVVHKFAQQEQSEGRNGSGNIFFESDWNSNTEYGTKLYSYGRHYLLAQFLDKDTIYINDEGYSNSTAKHIGEVSQATSQYRQFYATQCNLDLVYNDVTENYTKLAKARKPEIYINAITSKWETLNEFNAYKRNLTKIKKNPKYKEIKRIVNGLDLKTAQKALENEQARKNRMFKREVKQFKAHEINRISTEFKQYDVLRLSKDGTYIETNQAITVSTKEAKRLLNLIDNKKIIGARVNDQFVVTAFNGVFRAGCHNIPVSEINAIRKVLKS